MIACPLDEVLWYEMTSGIVSPDEISIGRSGVDKRSPGEMSQNDLSEHEVVTVTLTLTITMAMTMK